MILEECVAIRNKQGGCKVGEAVITNAGNLPAKKVIHTVGPRWNDEKSDEEEKLKSCYIECLKLAEKHNLKTIAFPNISTGIYRFPKERASKIAIDIVKFWESRIIEKVFFVCFDDEDFEIYKNRK